MEILPTAAHIEEKRSAGDFYGLIGRSAEMRELFELIRLIAPSEVPVLISGETGTGKEEVARLLHALSDRRQHPFIPVNCGALSETMVESELFGHVKGSFTGATDTRVGLFGAAHHGTLFLDEVGDLPLEMQVKLLRALGSGEVRRVGSTVPEQVDVRIVAATNVDLPRAVRERRFREDLYCRLECGVLRIPPLARRTGDLPHLCEHIVRRFGPRDGSLLLAAEALELLSRHPFPGNVRQLESVLRRAMLTARKRGTITAADIDFGLTVAAEAPPVPSSPMLWPDGRPKSMFEVEREAGIEALARTGGNISAAARELGIGRCRLRDITR